MFLKVSSFCNIFPAWFQINDIVWNSTKPKGGRVSEGSMDQVNDEKRSENRTLKDTMVGYDLKLSIETNRCQSEKVIRPIRLVKYQLRSVGRLLP